MEYRLLIRYIFYGIMLLILQLFLFNFVRIGIGLNAYIYILLILFLPVEIRPIWLLLIGFFYGFLFDVFNNTIAINAAATTLVAFVRPFILRIMRPTSDYEKGTKPSYYSMGLRLFIIYSLILIFIHQLVVFSLDIFSIQKIGIVLLKSFINTIYTAFYIVILNIIFFRNR